MMMKRILAAVVVATMMTAGVVSGDINISWFAFGGFFQADGTTPLLNVVGMSTLVQLIQVGPNGSIDPVDLLQPNYIGGDDILISQIVFTNPVNDGFNEYAAVNYGNVYTAAYSNYYFYGRIFQDSTPAALEYYFNTIVTNTANVLLPADQAFDFNNGNFAGDRIDQNQIPAVIPEPSTLALAGFGLMALVVRAIRRK